MSRTKSIFILSHDQKTTRLIRAFDGAMSSHYSRLQVGTIQGRVRTIPALVHPDATDQDMWRVVNLAGPSGTCFDSVAVLGALDDNQAAQWAMEEFGQYANAHVVQPVSCGNAKGVQYVLDHAVTHEPRMIRSDMLRSASDRVTSEAVLWDSMTLLSHLGTSAGLMRDLSSHDWDGELLDAMTLTDLAKLATDDAEVLNFDALIVQYNKLDTLVNRLTAAMAKSTVGDLKVTNVTQSKPFKKNGVAQVAVLFELSDGQTMTILLHNPDSTPTKIAPTDNLTSWKWLLNKRDVSAVVQPKQGEDVQMPVLAARMLKIATQNSARFKRTQGKRLEVEQTITDTQTRIQEKQGQLQALNNEIQALQGQIDEGLKAKPIVANAASAEIPDWKLLQAGENTQRKAKIDGNGSGFAPEASTSSPNSRKPDLTYVLNKDGFSEFWPETPAGEVAWREMYEFALKLGFDGKGIPTFGPQITKYLLKQLRSAGYRVLKGKLELLVVAI